MANNQSNKADSNMAGPAANSDPVQGIVAGLSPEVFAAAARIVPEAWIAWAWRFGPRIIWWTIFGYRNRRKFDRILGQLEPIAREALQDQNDRRESDLKAVALARIIHEMAEQLDKVRHWKYNQANRGYSDEADDRRRRESLATWATSALLNLPPLERTPSSTAIRSALEKIERSE